ncbi:MAG: hypothetical protein MN733_02650 [Nitrososphaera sp.]|nr:hypothetical protein [Nitrososphaera sp.]
MHEFDGSRMLSSTISRTILNPILDFLFPRACLNCQVLLADGKQYVCESCWNSIQRLHFQHPLYQDTRGKLLDAGQVDNLVSCFVFTTDGAFQALAHEMKYGQFQKLGIWLGTQLGEELNRQGIAADYLIPVPLHRRKFRERGYNQAELIARGVSEVTGIPARADFVHRNRFTETQTKLNIDERKRNMQEAFEVVSGSTVMFKGKHCIIIDDVITTGATITSCAGELKLAGAASIIAASLALAE